MPNYRNIMIVRHLVLTSKIHKISSLRDDLFHFVKFYHMKSKEDMYEDMYCVK